jgi:hypothetical protein
MFSMLLLEGQVFQKNMHAISNTFAIHWEILCTFASTDLSVQFRHSFAQSFEDGKVR